MAREQEANQRGIISQAAPGGVGASQANPPPTLPSFGRDPRQPGNPPRPAAPFGVPTGHRQCAASPCQVTLVTRPPLANRRPAHAKRGSRKEAHLAQLLRSLSAAKWDFSFFSQILPLNKSDFSVLGDITAPCGRAKQSNNMKT